MFITILSVDHVNVQDRWGALPPEIMGCSGAWIWGTSATGQRVSWGDCSCMQSTDEDPLVWFYAHFIALVLEIYLSKQWTWIKSHSSDTSHHRDISYLYVCIMSTSSLSQNTVQDLPRGPEPPFFNIGNTTLLPSLTADRVPVNKTFGDVLQEVRQQYRAVRASRIC